MSLSRIPLDRVFRSNSKSSPPREIITQSNKAIRPEPLPSPPYEGQSKDILPATITQGPIMSSPASSFMSGPPQRVMMGTRTPQMIEYERQAEERAKEQERMDDEKARMQEELSVMGREAERIAQEEYEMEQYYQAEALRHAEELRAHQDEIGKHQERVRAHERRMRDHEASSEAFAKVIAMPAKTARDKATTFQPSPVKRTGTGLKGMGPALPNGP